MSIKPVCNVIGPMIAGGMLLFAAGTARANDPPVTADVLTKLHHADKKEIDAGKLAEQNGKSEQVRDYGKMLVHDHTAADKKVVKLAKQEKIDLPDTAPATDTMKTAAAGADFDTRFAREMLDDHKKDIADLADARDTTSDKKLKKLLSDLLPTLQKHEETAQKIIDGASK